MTIRDASDIIILKLLKHRGRAWEVEQLLLKWYATLQRFRNLPKLKDMVILGLPLPKRNHRCLRSPEETAHSLQQHPLRIQGLPKPQKHVTQWPLWLLLGVEGYYSTYFWGPGRVLVDPDFEKHAGVWLSGDHELFDFDTIAAGRGCTSTQRVHVAIYRCTKNPACMMLLYYSTITSLRIRYLGSFRMFSIHRSIYLMPKGAPI